MEEKEIIKVKPQKWVFSIREDRLVFNDRYEEYLEQQLQAYKDTHSKLTEYIEACESRDEDARNEKLLDILDDMKLQILNKEER